MLGFMCVIMIRRARSSGNRGFSTLQLMWPGDHARVLVAFDDEEVGAVGDRDAAHRSIRCRPNRRSTVRPSDRRTAVEGAPEGWMTSAVVTASPRTSLGTPGAISTTSQGKRQFVPLERGKEHFERRGDAVARTGRAGDEQRTVAPAQELRVEQQKRQAAEMVAVQVAQDDGIDGVRVDVARAQRNQRGGAEIEKNPAISAPRP